MLRKSFIIILLISSQICIAQYTWEEISLPVDGDYNSILFCTNETGFITGRSEVDEAILLKTTNKGKDWNIFNITTTHKVVEFCSIDFISSEKGYISGWNTDSSFIAITEDQGTTWSVSYTGTNVKLTSIDFLNPSLGYGIALDDGVFKLSDIGQITDTLNLQYNGHPIPGTPVSLAIYDENTLFITYKELFAHTVYRVENESVVTVISPEKNSIISNMLNLAGKMIISGSNGLELSLYQTTNLGNVWQPKYMYCCTTKVHHLSKNSEEYAMAVGVEIDFSYNRKGLIVVTRDGGESWQKIPFEEDILLLQGAIADTNHVFFFGTTAQHENGEKRLFKRIFEPESIIITLEDVITLDCHETTQLEPDIFYEGTGTLTYSWEPAEGLSDPSIANPFVTSGYSNNYTLTVSDGETETQDDVEIMVNKPIYSPEICGVSYDPISGNNQVIIDYDSTVSAQYYKIYRKEKSYDEKIVLDSIFVDEPLVFTDTTNELFFYSVSYVDSCGMESPFYFNEQRMNISLASTDTNACTINLDGGLLNEQLFVYKGNSKNNLSVVDTFNSRYGYTDKAVNMQYPYYMLQQAFENCDYNPLNQNTTLTGLNSNIDSIDLTLTLHLKPEYTANCYDTFTLDAVVQYYGEDPLDYNWSPEEDLSQTNTLKTKTLVDRIKVYSLYVTDGQHEISRYVTVRPNPLSKPKSCLVTFDSTLNKNKIVFLPDSIYGFEKIYLNKETDLGIFSSMEPIDTFYSQTPISAIDYNSYPDSVVDKYSISIFDKCNARQSSDITGNILLKKSHSLNNTISWNAFPGGDYSYAGIWQGLSPKEMYLKDSLYFFMGQYTEMNPLGGKVFYQIEGMGGYEYLEENDTLTSIALSNIIEMEFDGLFIDLPDTLYTYCKDTTTLMPTITFFGEAPETFEWEPAQGLSDPTQANPLLTASQSGWYKLTISNSQNLSQDSVFVLLQPSQRPEIEIISTLDNDIGILLSSHYDTAVPVEYFKIYRDGVEYVAEDEFNNATFQWLDESISASNELHNYSVSMVDVCGIETSSSPALNNLVVFSNKNTGNTHLVWNKYNHPNGLEYNIWKGNSFEGLEIYSTKAIDDTSYIDPEPTQGTVYYKIEAVCEPGLHEVVFNEDTLSSAFSNLFMRCYYSPFPRQEDYPPVLLEMEKQIVLCNDQQVFLDTLFSASDIESIDYTWMVLIDDIHSVVMEETITLIKDSTFNLYVEDNTGCVYFDSIQLVRNDNCDETGIFNALTKNEFNIYPNPNSGYFSIELPEKCNIRNISIINTLGITVYNQNQIKYNTELLTVNIQTQPGLYYLLIQTVEGEALIFKLVINNRK